MVEALPPCSLKNIRAFLLSIDFHKEEDYTTSTREAWASKDNFTLVRFPIDEDPMPFSNVIALVEAQLRKGIPDLPFYAAQIAQRFDPEGRGGS